jgi:hypothetical protein
MHSFVELGNGTVDLALVAEDGDDLQRVDKSRWRAHLLPAICLLRSLGGGAMVVPHGADDLTGD